MESKTMGKGALLYNLFYGFVTSESCTQDHPKETTLRRL